MWVELNKPFSKNIKNVLNRFHDSEVIRISFLACIFPAIDSFLNKVCYASNSQPVFPRTLKHINFLPCQYDISSKSGLQNPWTFTIFPWLWNWQRSFSFNFIAITNEPKAETLECVFVFSHLLMKSCSYTKHLLSIKWFARRVIKM